MAKSKYSKFVAASASAALVATAVAPVASLAASFKDVPSTSDYYSAVTELSNKGVINGYPDGTFKIRNKVTRAEAAKMLSEVRGFKSDVSAPFNDVKKGSWYEKYVNALYAEGLVEGRPGGGFEPQGNLSRAEFSKLVVEAYDLPIVKDAKLPFNDLKNSQGKDNWAIDYISTLYTYGFINGKTTTTFAPTAEIDRGDMALLLNRVENGYQDIDFGVVSGVKAINATTVEVTYKENVTNIDSYKFSIDGLTISNAAVKQTDAKTVVLTTSKQIGGTKYTVKQNDQTIGQFEGISAVIPTNIKVNTTSTQGVVGKEVVLKADIGVKEANVPVTFNVEARSNSLNKDQVVEVYTNAEGIATFSYTQYNQGTDHVAVYPTGAPAVRDLATVYWGVKPILSIEEDKAGVNVANGTKKVYTVTYLDRQTGNPVAGANLNVTFLENIGVDYTPAVNATVTNPTNGVTVTPFQAKNGNSKSITVRTDSQGKATFTVSGTNVAVTPVVFVDQTSTINNQGNGIFDPAELVAYASKVTFAGAQVNYALTVERDGDAEAASGDTNGRVYKVKVLNPNDSNKPYAGGTVNLSLDELMDRNMSTTSNAKFKNVGSSNSVSTVTSNYGGVSGQQAKLKLDSKGEGSFVLYGGNNDQGTPVIWIDQNNSQNTQTGVLEDGEPSAKGAITYFQPSRVVNAALKVTNKANADAKDFPKGDEALFTFNITNQSGKEFGSYTGRVTFEVRNTGANALTLNESDDALYDQNGNRIGSTTIEVGGAITVTTDISNGVANLRLSSTEATSAKVTASAVTGANWSQDVRNNNKYVAAETFDATFSGAYVPSVYTGNVTAVNKTDKTVTISNGTNPAVTLSYKDAEYYYQTSSVPSTLGFFESRLSLGDLVTFTKGDGDKVKNKFDIITDVANATPVTDLKFEDNDANAGTISGNVTFSTVANHDYKLFLGNNEVAVNTSGDTATATIASTPYTEGLKLRVEATNKTTNATEVTTINVVDNRSATDAAAKEIAALAKINKAAADKDWRNVTLADFTDANITGVKPENVAKLYKDLEVSRQSKGSELTKVEIQGVVNNL